MPMRCLPAQPGQRASCMIKRAITRALCPLSGNYGLLFCYVAVWHEVEQNKCKHDQIKTWLPKIGYIFLSQTASSLLGTCKLPISHYHLQFVYEPGLSICHCRATPYNRKELRCCSFGMLHFPNNGCILWRVSALSNLLKYRFAKLCKRTQPLPLSTKPRFSTWMNVSRYYVSWMCMYKESKP